MSDIHCPRCGEPWELDSLHEVAQEQSVPFGAVRDDFMRRGCNALAGEYFGNVPECDTDENAATRATLADLMGDDVDGYISMLEDIGL